MTAFNDRAGQKFNRLTFVEYLGKGRWRLLCDCGNYYDAQTWNVVGGSIKSCGCYHKEVAAGINYKHGLSHTPEWTAWHNMIYRCYEPTHSEYKRYGQRNIAVCEQWRTSFETFLQDMGPRPTAQHSLDRIDNDGHYEPGNCRWATRDEQNNNKRNNRHVTAFGETKTLQQWSVDPRCNVCYAALKQRLNYGWSAERALTQASRA